jgi:hypothetical protein
MFQLTASNSFLSYRMFNIDHTLIPIKRGDSTGVGRRISHEECIHTGSRQGEAGGSGHRGLPLRADTATFIAIGNCL